MKILFSLCIIFFSSILGIAQNTIINPYWGTLHIAAGGLITLPSTDYHDATIGSGLNIGVGYFLPVNSNHIFGVEFGVNKFQIKGYDERNVISTESGSQIIPNEFYSSIFSYNLSVSYSYKFNNYLFPYIGIGSSYNFFSPTDINDQPLINNIKKKYDKEFLNFYGILGIRYFINEKFSLGAAVNFFNPATDYLDDINVGSSDDYYSTIKIYFAYCLFGNGDSDNDGILDKIDLCKDQPEDIDGFQDEDGCPDLDNDNDGVYDKQDECPNEPEDIDGYKDLDGCPDLDNDGDGILDKLDQCPNDAEDKDYFQDSDGCPDEDNDKDGILDIYDKCPDSPETINGFEDDDGCPDSAPQRDKNEDIKQIVLEGDLIFGVEGTGILPNAFIELDRIVEILRNYPDAKWRIEGHVDSRGSEQSIRVKSTKRAEAILQYFIDKGLDGSKFEIFGMGDKFPIANNTTDYGRQRNRRILIVRQE